MKAARHSWLHAAVASAFILGSVARGAAAEDTIKIGILHSLSGTMAISETTLKDVMLMLIDEQNKKGGLLGKKLEPVVVDPASNWPLFAEKARELISKDKVAVVFGCWTSVSRKSVLPVFKELNSILFYPRAIRGRGERAQHVLHRRRRPTAGHPRRRISDEHGRRRGEALGARRHRLRLSAHHQQDHPTPTCKYKGVKRTRTSWMNYTPFGFSDWQTEVAEIKTFGSAGKKTAVVSTINGDANVPFYKELGNQGIKATDIPVIAFSVGEEELAGLDTKPLVGHLAAWNYFESVEHAGEQGIHRQVARLHARNRSAPPTTRWKPHYICFNMWVKAVQQAGTTDVDAVTPGDDRPEGQVAVRVRSDHAAEPSHGEAGDDRRNAGQRPVRHRLSEQGAAAQSLEPLCRSQQRQGRRLVVALGLRRLYRAEVLDLLVLGLPPRSTEHRAQSLVTARPAVTRLLFYGTPG